MSSTFFGLQLSRRALESQQIALNTTGHNIANASTQGYTRQTANLKATTPDTISALGGKQSLGTGVTIGSITRARDAFVDNQFRSETSKQQYWETRQDNLSQVEGIMNEPSDSSLSGDLDNFWNAWSDLSQNPEDAGARSVVVERTVTLTDSLHSISMQISELQSNIDSNVKTQISQINDYASRISDLNVQIKRAEISGDQPNDLYDSRDNLVDELAKIVNVKVTKTLDSGFTNGQVSDYKLEIGYPPQTLVDGGVYNQLVGVPADPTTGIGDNEITMVQWSNGDSLELGTDVGVIGVGSLQANIDSRAYLTGLQDKYDELAQGIVTAVNDIYGSETDASDTPPKFFDVDDTIPVTASNISSSVAAGDIVTGAGAAGDGSIAAEIASLATGWSSLKDSDLDEMKDKYGVSLGDFYGSTVSQLGVDVQQATRMKTAEDVLVSNATNQRESISGVSLDEEMTNLIKFQKAYSAAARMVTMMDDMLSTLLNMGITK